MREIIRPLVGTVTLLSVQYWRRPQLRTFVTASLKSAGRSGLVGKMTVEPARLKQLRGLGGFGQVPFTSNERPLSPA